MLPRCYRFDGSTGMDLRPAAVLEAEDARRTELRRRHEPMAVTTRIRMVGQPPGGLLPLSLFDHVPLADRMGLHPVYGQINVYGVTTKSERHKRSYWTRTADGNGIGGRKAPVPYGS